MARQEKRRLPMTTAPAIVSRVKLAGQSPVQPIRLHRTDPLRFRRLGGTDDTCTVMPIRHHHGKWPQRSMAMRSSSKRATI